MTRSRSDASPSLSDEACAALWDRLAKTLELESWTTQKMNHIEDVIDAIRAERRRLLARQRVVVLREWREVTEK